MTSLATPAGRLSLPRSIGDIRIGVVGFVNTLPLIDGLERLREVELRCAVPSHLLGMLLEEEVDVALCSSIDYQLSAEPLVVVPAGLLGCDGATLTVRLYSSVPIDEIDEVCCDTDSHTSVVLMRILFRELYGIDPATIDYDARERVAGKQPPGWPRAMLLIGDKVVTDAPPAPRYPHQLDLGKAWTSWTGLPFVFALWMARRSADPSTIAVAAAVLDRQRRHNAQRLDGIVHRAASEKNWPLDLAGCYLRNKLAFEMTPRRREGLELFFDKAVEHGLAARRRALEIAAV